jgi:hypothetical protein
MPGTACIIPDYCILISADGANWCATMDGAMKWPEGQPELAEPVLSADEHAVPRGCTCVNNTEGIMLVDHLPIEAYVQLRAEIEAATRENCLTLAVGFANNCLAEGPNAPVIAEESPDPDKHGPCVGDCEYFKPPPYEDCPRDPTPFECEDLVHGGNDEADDGGACPIGAEDCPCTVGGSCDDNLECVDGMCVPVPSDEEVDDGSDTGPVLACPDDLCSLDFELAMALRDEPRRLAESTEIIAVDAEQIIFELVQEDSVLHRLGLRSGDVLGDVILVDDQVVFDIWREGRWTSVTHWVY